MSILLPKDLVNNILSVIIGRSGPSNPPNVISKRPPAPQLQPFLENFNQLQHVAGFVKPDNIMPLLHVRGLGTLFLLKPLPYLKDTYFPHISGEVAVAKSLVGDAVRDPPWVTATLPEPLWGSIGNLVQRYTPVHLDLIGPQGYVP